MPFQVATLLIAGANVHAQDQHLATPLHFAAESGHDGVAVALLLAGADVDALDDRQRNAAFGAEEGGHAAVKHTLSSSHRMRHARIPLAELEIRAQCHY